MSVFSSNYEARRKSGLKFSDCVEEKTLHKNTTNDARLQHAGFARVGEPKVLQRARVLSIACRMFRLDPCL